MLDVFVNLINFKGQLENEWEWLQMAKEVESHSRQGGIQFWEDTGSHTCVCATCEYMEEFVYLMGYVAESK